MQKLVFVGIAFAMTLEARAQLGDMPAFITNGPAHFSVNQRNLVQYKTSSLENAPNVRARLFADDLGRMQVCSIEDAIYSGDAFEPVGFGEEYGFATTRGQLLPSNLGGSGCGEYALYNVFTFGQAAYKTWQEKLEQPLFRMLLSKRWFAVDLTIEILEFHPKGLILEVRVKLVAYNSSFRKIRQTTGILSTNRLTGEAVYLE